MNRFISSSLTILKEAVGSQENPVPYLKETEPSMDYQVVIKNPQGDRLSIEINDPDGRCVQLEKQLAAVQRSVVFTLQREIARIKANSSEKLGTSETPELEIILMPTMTMSEDEDSSDTDEEYYNKDNANWSQRNEEPPRPLVDQSLHWQIKHELLCMRDSLETTKEWRSFYAYHLERFRQMHNAVVLQYQVKLAEVDDRCQMAEEDLRTSYGDMEQNRQSMADCSQEVVQVENQNKRLHCKLDFFKHASATRLLKLRSKNEVIKSCLESELQAALDDNRVIEKENKKLQLVKKEGKSYKRLNEVLNDKLREKTIEVTDLFAENLKLREQGMFLRRDQAEAAKKTTAQANDSEKALKAIKDLKEKVLKLQDRVIDKDEGVVVVAVALKGIDTDEDVALNQLLTTQLQESDTLVEIQQDELEQTEHDMKFSKEEFKRLRTGAKFESEVNDGPFLTRIERALNEAIECNKMQAEDLQEARDSNESLRHDFNQLVAELMLERDYATAHNESLQEQLEETTLLTDMQERDVEEYQREILGLAEEVATVKSEMELETEQNFELNENIALRLQEVLCLKEIQAEQTLEVNILNAALEGEVAKLKSEVQSLEKRSAELNNSLDSQLEESRKLAYAQAQDLESLPNINASLTEQLSSFKSEREETGEENINLKVELGGLQMDNALLQYEVDQLKSHLTSVMEENVLLTESNLDDEQYGSASVPPQVDFSQGDEIFSLGSMENVLLIESNLDDEQYGNTSVPSQVDSSQGDEIFSLGSTENVLRTESNLDDEQYGNASVPSQADSSQGDEIFSLGSMEDSTVTSSYSNLDPSSSSHLTELPTLSGDTMNRIKAQFGQLDDTLRDNEALLDRLCESGLIPERKACRLSIKTDEESTFSMSKDTEDEADPVSAITMIVTFAGPNLPQVERLSSLGTDLGLLVDTNEVAPVSPSKTVAFAPRGSNEIVTSIPSDDFLSIKNARCGCDNGESNPVAKKSSTLLADHLIDVLQGKGGSDNAVLEQMDNLRPLLVQEDNEEAYVEEFKNLSPKEFDDSLGLGMEVTLAQFNAQDVFDRLFHRDNIPPVDEWFDCTSYHAFTFDSSFTFDSYHAFTFDSAMTIDDASREECADPADPSEGEDRIEKDLDMTNVLDAIKSNKLAGDSPKFVNKLARLESRNAELIAESLAMAHAIQKGQR